MLEILKRELKRTREQLLFVKEKLREYGNTSLKGFSEDLRKQRLEVCRRIGFRKAELESEVENLERKIYFLENYGSLKRVLGK